MIATEDLEKAANKAQLKRIRKAAASKKGNTPVALMKLGEVDVATTVGESVSNTRPMRKPKKKTIGAKPVDRAELTTYDSPRSVGDPQSERY